MLPSEADLQGWPPVFLFGGLVVLLSAPVGFVPRIPAEVIYPLERLGGAMRGEEVEYRWTNQEVGSLGRRGRER